ncbi:endonuclease/exonuclease/phosphatase family protein [Saccharibacillus sp. CPCC 101409]|uniref:endonuclease/exonuclease/phosphatase family protein n=1 Tax=Saccharibacillus sp. CPCC 101409 TaxID=3058041 RepID=UPI002671B863|nr:endonuclease/exonuclease/phosphatase family protein [Saccharibacillus sp. CPCC 101409]MDO3411958.1 endonuclease/exonuclease/phosphatase family protein [Saccharibacillus sp. CPCC 101409]
MTEQAGTTGNAGENGLKIMTFNLRTHTANDAGNEWLHRASQAAETIAAHAPSFAGVQEGYLIMLEELERELPGYDRIGEGRLGGIQDEHCAIFYRKNEFEPLEQGQFWLSETPESVGSLGWDSDYPRICTWGRFRHLASGSEIRVYNTHLDHIGETARIEGAKLVAAAMLRHKEQRPGSFGILMGDMNGGPSDAPLRYLRGELAEAGLAPGLVDAYTALPGEVGRTFHDFLGGLEGEPIDYIFAEAPLEVSRTVVDRRDFSGKYPSDHYPVIAELVLPGI